MSKFARRNSLGLFFGAIFLASLLGQAIAGWQQFNDDQFAGHLARISLPDYLGSANFAADVAENWQSEYLQFLLYIVATVWFLQRGSPESKKLGQAGKCWDEAEKEFKLPKYESMPGYANGLPFVARRYCGLWGRGT